MQLHLGILAVWYKIDCVTWVKNIKQNISYVRHALFKEHRNTENDVFGTIFKITKYTRLYQSIDGITQPVIPSLENKVCCFKWVSKIEQCISN